MDGVIVVDKPAGMTSHDVVDVARRSLRTKRVGHAGTLDPDATGVLVLGVGKATRFLSYAQNAPKRYIGRVRFGVTTSTQDASGEEIERREAVVSAADVKGSLEEFTGDIEQVPPMVSAVKVGGERLYHKARRGEEVERTPRSVRIYGLELLSFTDGDEPEAELDVICSAGTYIRTLAHDLGERLGCGAHLSSLRRTEAGGFTLDDASALDEISGDRLLGMIEIVRTLPRIEVSDDEASAIADGRPISASGRDLPEGDSAALISEGELLAVYRRSGERLVAEKVVPR